MPTVAELQAQIAELTAQNAKLAASRVSVGKLSCKVSEKGALSVYGLGRFPVSLYKSQWTRLIDTIGEVKAFMDANGDRLTEKQ